LCEGSKFDHSHWIAKTTCLLSQLLSKVTDVVLHQMFNVSALLLDDALLKCVITEVVLFSIVAFVVWWDL